MTGNKQEEEILAHAMGVAAYAEPEWEERSFAKLAWARCVTEHEQQAFIRGFIAAAVKKKKEPSP